MWGPNGVHKMHQRSEGKIAGVVEESPGFEPRESAGVVGGECRGSVENSAGVARRGAPAGRGG